MMNIEPTDLYHQQAFSILKELKHKFDLGRSKILRHSLRLFPPTQDNDIFSLDKQAIFLNFENDNILKVVETYPSYVHEIKDVGQKETLKTASKTMVLELQEPAFSKYLNEYKEAFGLPRRTKLTIHRSGYATLSANGKRYEIKLSTKSDSFKILMLLAVNKDNTVSYAEIGKILKKRPDKETSDERRARDSVQYIKVNKFRYNLEDFIQTDYGFRLVCDVEIIS